jgi:hypothetical protein
LGAKVSDLICVDEHARAPEFDSPSAFQPQASANPFGYQGSFYAKLLGEREYRLEWAERIGLEFKIPGSVGQPGLFRVVANPA